MSALSMVKIDKLSVSSRHKEISLLNQPQPHMDQKITSLIYFTCRYSSSYSFSTMTMQQPFLRSWPLLRRRRAPVVQKWVENMSMVDGTYMASLHSATLCIWVCCTSFQTMTHAWHIMFSWYSYVVSIAVCAYPVLFNMPLLSAA